MKWERLVKWLGAGCVLAGIARMGMTPSALIWGANSTPEIVCGLTACILMSAASFALYFVQAEKTRWIGLLTVSVIAFGNLLTSFVLWGFLAYGDFAPETSALAAVTGLVSSVGVLGGSVVLPILTWRAKVLPAWVLLFMALMPLSLALPWTDGFPLCWGLSYVAAGYCIWAGKRHASFVSQSGAASA